MSPGTPLAAQVRSALEWLEAHGSKSGREAMARYAIPSDKAYGVSVANIKVLGKKRRRAVLSGG